MKFSYNKLENFLRENGFVVDKIYSMNDFCIYLEILDIKTTESFMLYIPSKYEILVENRTSYVLKDIIIPLDTNVSTDYINNIENINSYEDTELYTEEDDNNIENHLEKFYNYPINLKNVENSEIQEVKSIIRQLKRFRLCVKYVKYNLSIIFSNYLCSIHKSGQIMGYYIKNFNSNGNHNLYVVLDLELLLKNTTKIVSDIIKIKKEVYKILSKNQSKHNLLLENIKMNKITALKSFKTIEIKKEKLSGYMLKLEKLLEVVSKAEKEKIEKIMILGESISGLETELQKTHKISKIEGELDELNLIKREIFYNIQLVKSNYENLVLKMDNLCFDNIVMLDSVNKNLQSLISFS